MSLDVSESACLTTRLTAVVTFFGLILALSSSALAQSGYVDVNSQQQATDQTKKDLIALGTLIFENPSTEHIEIFGDSPLGVLDFVRDRIKYMSYAGDIGSKGVVAHADVLNGVPTVTLGWLHFQMSLLGRMSVLIHEARHLEPQVHHHIDCGTPFVFEMATQGGSNLRATIPSMNNMTNACDTHSFGAYGTQYIFLRSIVNSCVNCSAEMKAEADRLSLQALLRIRDPKSAEAVFILANPIAKWPKSVAELQLKLRNLEAK